MALPDCVLGVRVSFRDVTQSCAVGAEEHAAVLCWDTVSLPRIVVLFHQPVICQHVRRRSSVALFLFVLHCQAHLSLPLSLSLSPPLSIPLGLPGRIPIGRCLSAALSCLHNPSPPFLALATNGIAVAVMHRAALATNRSIPHPSLLLPEAAVQRDHVRERSKENRRKE